MYAVEPDEAVAQLHAALAGDATALPALKALSDYRDGELPYEPEVLYERTPRDDHHAQRLSNAVALDSAISTRFLKVAVSEHASGYAAGAKAAPTPTQALQPDALPPRQRPAGKTSRETKQLVYAAAIIAVAYIAITHFGAEKQNSGPPITAGAGTTPEYQAACQGMPLRTIDKREKALEDGYEVLGRFDCISKASFAAAEARRAKASAGKTD